MKRLASLGTLCAAFALTVATLQPAMAEGAGDGIGSFDEVLPGTEAIEALGSDLPKVAKSLDVSVPELKEALNEEHTSVLPNGRIAMAHAPAPAGTAPIALAADWDVPSSKVFSLSSKPGAAKTIYLDFNGHTMAKSNVWVKDYGFPRTVPGYSIDSNTKKFNKDERRAIAWIWAQVAEDFAPFDVNVTTKAPKKIATTLGRSKASDKKFGAHVVISNQNLSKRICQDDQGEPTWCSGVAFVGTFDHYKNKKFGGSIDQTASTDYQPAWVFDGPNTTGQSAAYIADTASHEAGHNLGLLHSSTLSTGYYGGHNNWASIMGTTSGFDGTYRPVSQWSNDHYPGANYVKDGIEVIHQDQLAVMQSFGLPKRADESANTVAEAKKLRAGFIGVDTDEDVVLIGHCPAGAVIESGGATMSNLDTALTLLRPNGAVAASSPATTSGASATGLPVSTAFPSYITKPSNLATSVTVPSDGVYYLRVAGEGSTQNSYPRYGSVGRWSVSSPCDTNGIGNESGAPENLTAATKSKAVTLSWTTPTTGRIQDITGWRITRTGSKKNVNVSVNGRSKTITGLKNGTNYTFTVRPLIGKSKKAGAATAVISATPKTVPSTPKISKAKSGAKGGDITASVTWKAPSNGGSPITAYYVTAKRYSGKKVVQTITTPALPATTRTYEMALPTAAKYVFTVTAENEIGKSKASKASSKVNGR